MIQNSSINGTIYLQYLILQMMKTVAETTENKSTKILLHHNSSTDKTINEIRLHHYTYQSIITPNFKKNNCYWYLTF